MKRFIKNISCIYVAVAVLASAAGPVFAAPVPVGAQPLKPQSSAPANRRQTVDYITRELQKQSSARIVPPVLGWNDAVHNLYTGGLFFGQHGNTFKQNYREISVAIGATLLGELLAGPFPSRSRLNVSAPSPQFVVRAFAADGDGTLSFAELLKLERDFDQALRDIQTQKASATGIDLVKLNLAEKLVMLKRDIVKAVESRDYDAERLAVRLTTSRIQFRNYLRETIAELFGVVADMDAQDASTKAILTLVATLVRTTVGEQRIRGVRDLSKAESLTELTNAALAKLTGTLPDRTPTRKKVEGKLAEKGFYELLKLLDQLPAQFDDVTKNIESMYRAVQSLRREIEDMQSKNGPPDAQLERIVNDVRPKFEAVIKRFLSGDIAQEPAMRETRRIIKAALIEQIKVKLAIFYGDKLAAALANPAMTNGALTQALTQLRDATVRSANAQFGSPEDFSPLGQGALDLLGTSDAEKSIRFTIEYQVLGSVLAYFVRGLDAYDKYDSASTIPLAQVYTRAVNSFVVNINLRSFLGDALYNFLFNAGKLDFVRAQLRPDTLGEKLKGNDSGIGANESPEERKAREQRNAEIKATRAQLDLVDTIVSRIRVTLQQLMTNEMAKIKTSQDAIANIAGAIEARGDAILEKMKEQLGQSVAIQETKNAGIKRRKSAINAAAKKAGASECPVPQVGCRALQYTITCEPRPAGDVGPDGIPYDPASVPLIPCPTASQCYVNSVASRDRDGNLDGGPPSCDIVQSCHDVPKPDRTISDINIPIPM